MGRKQRREGLNYLIHLDYLIFLNYFNLPESFKKYSMWYDFLASHHNTKMFTIIYEY